MKKTLFYLRIPHAKARSHCSGYTTLVLQIVCVEYGTETT